MLTGTYEVRLDRGRLTLPSRLRDQMDGRQWDRMGILPWRDLVLLVAGGSDVLSAAICAVTDDTPHADRELMRAVASGLVIEVMDHRGRLTLPRVARSVLGGPQARAVGVGKHVELGPLPVREGAAETAPS